METVLLQLLINTTAIVSYLLENGRPKGDAYKVLESCLETSVQMMQSVRENAEESKDGQENA